MTPDPYPAAEPRDSEGLSALADSRTVLVVSPSPPIAGEYVGALQDLGLPALMVARPRQALYWLREVPPALVLVDLQADGANILVPELRRQGREVVVLSDDARSRQMALAAGCIEAHHRSDGAGEIARHIASLVRARDIKRIGRIVAGPLVVDLSGGRLVYEGRDIQVSPLLLNLAAHLAARAGSFVPAAVLLEEVWGEPWADPGKLQLAVLRLRRRLNLDSRSLLLASRRGHGYGVFPETPLSERPALRERGV